MPFRLPAYHPPDFSRPPLRDAPPVRFATVRQDGVAPEGYHATSIYPEFFQLRPGEWRLPWESRMDCVVVRRGEELAVLEFRRLREGVAVACGRREEKRCRRGERGEAAQRAAPREAVRRARVAAPAGDAADAALDAAAGGSLPPIDQT